MNLINSIHKFYFNPAEIEKYLYLVCYNLFITLIVVNIHKKQNYCTEKLSRFHFTEIDIITHHNQKENETTFKIFLE